MRSLLLALAGAAGTVLVDSGSEKIVSITDTPFPFSTSPYSVTGEAAFASSCPCRWLAGERPDPLLDQILVVNDYSCTTSCSAVYAACAASLLNATGVILSENFDKQFELQNVGMTAAQVEAAKAAQVGAAVVERQQYGAVANTSGCLALPATMLTSNGTQRLLQAANWSSSNINWTDPPLLFPAEVSVNVTMTSGPKIDCTKYAGAPYVYSAMVPVWLFLAGAWAYNTYRWNARHARDLHKLMCWVPIMESAHGLLSLLNYVSCPWEEMSGVIFATFWAVLTILKEPVLLLCLLLVAKGWCITRRSLERREVCVVGVILSLLYASVSVEMSVDSWLALAPMVLMYLVMLYEICSSILSNLRILKAQILALRSLGVDPLTTPAHTKYRMYCRLLGLVFVYALVETVLHWSYSAGRYAMSTFLTIHQLMELVIAVGIGHTFRARHFNVLFTQVQQVAAELADQMLPSITTVQLKESELHGQNLIAWRPTLNLPGASSAPNLPPTLVVLNPGDSELPQPPRSARRPPGLAGLAAPPPGPPPPPPREDEGNDVELLPMPDRRDEARSATSERGAIVPSIAREVSLALDDGDRTEVV